MVPGTSTKKCLSIQDKNLSVVLASFCGRLWMWKCQANQTYQANQTPGSLKSQAQPKNPGSAVNL